MGASGVRRKGGVRRRVIPRLVPPQPPRDLGRHVRTQRLLKGDRGDAPRGPHQDCSCRRLTFEPLRSRLAYPCSRQGSSPASNNRRYH
jgi:hypothetical protein